MAPIVSTVDVDRPPEKVFAYLTDLERGSEWQEGLVRMRTVDGGQQGVGTKVKMTRRVGKREQTMTSELTEWSPPRSFAFRGIDGPVRAIGRGTVEPLDDGRRSRVRFELDFEGHGIGKLLVPLFVRRQAQKEAPGNYQRLKEKLESGAA